MITNDPIELIVERNQFYRRMYLLALGVFGLSIGVLAALVWVLVYVVKNPTEPIYFATDEVGRLIKVQPVSQPNMSNDDVTRWAINVAQAAFSYDYVNYRAQLQGAQKYFTNYGWTQYMKALVSNNNLVALTKRSMIFSATVVDKPKIVAQGLLGGAYAWKFQMPMLVTYWLPPYNDKSRFANALEVTLIVQRQSILQSDHGLGVLQIIGNMAVTPQTPQQSISASPTG